MSASKRLDMTLTRLQDTTAEIRVRGAVVLLVAFVALAEAFGLESILGAFMAGAVVGIVDKDSASHPHFRLKLEAIGYGFLIPVFFVTSGLRLDLAAWWTTPRRWPGCRSSLLALLARARPAGTAVRPALRPSLGPRGRLLQATSLPFIVTATQIGVVTGLMSAVTAAALVCAGLLSVILFPAVALSLLRASENPDEPSRPVPSES